MGDRIALRFREHTSGEISVVLYAHWDGMALLGKAEDFWAEYKDEIRHEPSNWMVNFLAYIREGCIGDGEYYLYPDVDHCCSPDDNGYWEFDLTDGVYHRI